MKKHIAAVVMVSGLALAGCGRDSVTGIPVSLDQNRAAGPGNGNLSAGFTSLEISQEGPWAKAAEAVFYSEEDWTATMAAWAEEGRLSILPAPEVPAGVNWKKEAVILIAAGELPTGPASVEVTSFERDGSVGIVRARLEISGSSGYMTSPYHLIKVERRGLDKLQVMYE
jgi:hypothetical protein